MSVEDVQRFYERLAEDRTLMEKIAKAGEELRNRLATGEDSEEARLAEAYALIEPLARESGCVFTLADIESYVSEKRHKLSDEDLESVTGGVKGLGVCVVVGAGDNMDGTREQYCCVFGGPGSKESLKCYCVIGGYGKQ